MRIALIIFAAALFTLPLCAQEDTCDVCGKRLVKDWHASYNLTLNPILSIEDTSANGVLLDFDFHQNSNSINTVFAGVFLSKGTITDAMKKRVLNFGGDRILYEDELKAGLAYHHYFKKQKLNLWVSYYHRNMRNLNSSRDAFRIAFSGNKFYEDKTADLSQIHFENLLYNQYSVGISQSAGKFTVGANLSFLQGFNDQQLLTGKSTLYTAPQGEYLDALYKFRFNQSNSGASHFFDANGLGFSGDFHLVYKTPKIQWSLDITDLGFITWKKDPVNFSADTAIRFEGLVINDITKIGQNFSADSLLKDLLPQKTTQRYSTILPFNVQLVYSKPIALKNGKAMVVNIGLNVRNLYHYYVYGYAKLNFLLQKQWCISASAGYGGYSSFTLGLEVAKRSKWVDVAIGTSNLIGSVVPMYYPGSSAYLRVAAKF